MTSNFTEFEEEAADDKPALDDLNPYLSSEADADLMPYRAVCKTALLAFFFTLLSLLAYYFAAVSVLALAGCILGLVGLAKTRRYPAELTGGPLATISALAGGIIFVSSLSIHAYIYATEVPEGYERISFADLQPQTHDEDVSKRAIELNEQRVFVKGYVFPGDKRTGLTDFILVRDLGTCCFGKTPKPTHMIRVKLTGGHEINYSLSRRKLAGTLHVNPTPARGEVYFTLEADYLK